MGLSPNPATQTELDALAAAVPTVEDMQLTASDAGGFTVTTGVCFIPIMFPCVIVAAAIISNGTTISTSDTNYWLVQLRRWRAGASVLPFTPDKSTKVTGGSAITTRVPWNFDAQTWNTPNATCQKDDAVDVAWFATGTPTAPNKITLALRYEPV